MEKCLWCTTSLEVEGDVAVVAMLRRYSSGKLSRREMDSLNEDLSCCLECVVEYHRARDKVPDLHKHLWEMEKARLVHLLGTVLDKELEEDDIFIVEDDHEEPVSKMSPVEFRDRLRFSLFEVLKYPYLLCYRDLCDLVVKALCKLQDMKQSLTVFEKYQGTYLLLVHPNEQVRRWAIDTAKTMKSVDRDSYYDLQEIFFCMFYVIELGISLDFPDLEPESYAGGAIQMLPSHLYDSQDKKNYWLGICMLLTQLSAEAMDSLFMGQFNIPLCILNTMEGLKNEDNPASDPFWPALHCFMVILDRLGSKIWGQVDPNMAFQTITGAASYVAELRNIQKKTMRGMVKVEPEYDDNMVTCSQMVYDCYASKKTNKASGSLSNSGIFSNYMIYEDMQSLVTVLDSEMGQSMRVYGSTFLWFIPFVRSIMELPELNASYISEVIHYLCDKIRENRHALTGQTSVYDKVTEYFTRILIQIVELHSTEGRMEILSRCAQKWVEEIVLCVILSDEPHAPPDRMGGIHGVSSTSCNLGIVGKLPASGGDIGDIIHGCMKLIRLLLKEGIRRSVPDSTLFFNLLNKQMRGVAKKRWNLTRSQSDELQKCLLRVVRSRPERPASPLSVVPPSCAPSVEATTNTVISRNSVTTLHQQQLEDQEAGPSRAGDASAFIKEEPLWNYGNGNSDEDFLSGLEKTVKAKEEPPDPVSISKQRPLVQMEHIKPDLGKVQEIRSRLNDNQNLSKIKAIAKQKPDESLAPFHLTSAKVECGFGAAEEDDDDEPLDVRQTLLIKSVSYKIESSDSEADSSAAGKTHNRSMGSSKENVKSSTIVISEDSDNDEKPNDILRSPEDCVLPESPGRDYNDLSESQVFEFETQKYVASSWDDSDRDASVLTEKQKSEQLLKPQVDEAPREASPSSETELIPDEDIERTCQQAEDNIRELQQQPQESADSSALSLSKASSTAESWDKFVQPKPLPGKSAKISPSYKKKPKKPLIIDALALKTRRHPWKRNFTSQGEEEPSSPSSSCVSSVFPPPSSHGTPAIVPPKKVRKVVEPESKAERLGLKKKERKAFELSQRSLDCVAKLRCHGQKVQVEPQQKMRRVRRAPEATPQKRIVKGNKKLIGSQDIQFFRQCREKHQRPATLAPKPAKINQPGEVHLPEPTVASSEAVDFFHGPQLDPDHQQDNENAATETSSKGDGVGNDRRIESEYFQASETADVNMEQEKPIQTSKEEEEDDEEWMFLTQMGPSEMELCSHMEQLEEDDEVFLTQREPVDMDIEPDSESDTPGQPVLTPIQIQTPNGGNDDHLFLKPGMSPMSQKKAKPSTTKIYTPSSRSASLALEMEKGAKPPPAAGVAKAKISRLPPAMPPPKTFQPLHPPQLPKPLPSQQSPYAPKLVTSNKTSSTSEPTSYKVYQRPETPVNKPVPATDQSSTFDLSVLTQAILKWEYRMLDNYKASGSPHDLCQLPLKKVPVQFSSYQEYFNTLYPLLHMNAFEEMASEWLKEGRVKLHLTVQGIEYSNRTASASFTARISKETDMKQLYPKENDLVLLLLPDNTGAYAHDEPNFREPRPHFGYVSMSSVSNRDPGSWSTLNLTIQTRGNVSSVNTQSVLCEVIGSLVNTFREFSALCSLRSGPMLRPLLAPNASHFTHTLDSPPDLDSPEFNRDQARAISCGLAMIQRTTKTPKFLLIHGPPGTGKSKTIGGLLYKLLSSGINSAAPVGKLHSKSRRTRVLLCAPSNTAIDSLMKKVILIFKEKCRDINAPQGNCGDINLVRLGNERTMSKSLIPFSLDYQTKARAQRAQQTVEADIHRQKEQLDQNINDLSQRCAKTKKDSSEFKKLTEQKLRLLNERKRLSRQIKEASQAKETETLIPMLYRSPAVILVGDPNQLPPTVVSQKAKEFGFDQSFMARLCKSVCQSNPQLSPILLLSEQYRMHPEISEFPSKYIYNRALKDDCETAQKRCSPSWPFNPYKVFDVTDGREKKERDSFSNRIEVELVVLLLKLLVEKQSVRVGVITPYNAQKQRILEAIRSSGIEQQVDVDTVDGFQGREMDCIIVSCVRTSSETDSIGFVGNRQRMNVTLTRAKFSLFILGHLSTLREQSDWGALFEDARRRKTIIETKQKYFKRDVKQILKPEREPLARSLSYPSIMRPSTVTTPVIHAPVETGPAPMPHPQRDTRIMPIPLECTNNPRMNARPRDPRCAERRPIREQRPDRDRWDFPGSCRTTNRANSCDSYSRNTGQSSRYYSKHRGSSPSRRHRR
uniref:Senataxin n=1 Tax=Cyprinus carpio carpio TaxID=630221 RepID=A0A8C1BJV7_CYPCA